MFLLIWSEVLDWLRLKFKSRLTEDAASRYTYSVLLTWAFLLEIGKKDIAITQLL